MTPEKKQSLQKILESLIPYRSFAEGFLKVIQEAENEELMDALYNTIIIEIKHINNENDRQNIKKILKNIKAQEEKENKDENEYLENLINTI